jgi:uncharacterized protein YpmB
MSTQCDNIPELSPFYEQFLLVLFANTTLLRNVIRIEFYKPQPANTIETSTDLNKVTNVTTFTRAYRIVGRPEGMAVPAVFPQNFTYLFTHFMPPEVVSINISALNFVWQKWTPPPQPPAPSKKAKLIWEQKWFIPTAVIVVCIMALISIYILIMATVRPAQKQNDHEELEKLVSEERQDQNSLHPIKENHVGANKFRRRLAVVVM